ncbi:MAG: hypothetical protein J0H55_13425 [Chitinophagaceae bacterium]|nr:hypothetical protein [Chitinophagaceae bacterium]
MKPFLISLILFGINANSYGQLDQNTWLVGGSGSFYKYTENFSSQPLSFIRKTRTIDVSGAIGYFIIDKTVVGLRPFLSASETSSSGVLLAKNYAVAFGPFARYYFLRGERRANLLMDIGYAFGRNLNRLADGSKGKNNIFSLVGGIEAFFNSTAGIEVLFGYVNRIVSTDNASDPQLNQSSNKKGFQFSIGFQIHLKKTDEKI